MRSDLELLTLLLSELNSTVYFTGLCYLVAFNGIYEDAEKDRLLQMIKENKPRHAVTDSYYWVPGEKKHRRAFLENLISKLEANS